MKDRTHILVVMGEGGHSKECLRLVDLLGADRYRFSYLLVREDEVTASKLRVPGPVYRVIRPGCEKDRGVVGAMVKYPLCALQTAAHLLRSRPAAVITTGPAVAVPVSLVARLLGVRVLFVETGSRIHELSVTGKLMRYVADLYFVQWEELLPAVPGSRFAGRLF